MDSVVNIFKRKGALRHDAAPQDHVCQCANEAVHPHCGHHPAHHAHHPHHHPHHGPAVPALPLTLASTGAPVTVIKIGGRDDTRTFLTNLGFVEGAQVTVVCESCGNLIVEAKGARIALSRQMAARVMVQ